MVIPINFLAVVIAAVISMALGFFWYGPIFGQQWIQMMGWTPEQMAAAKAKGMAKSYALTAVGSLVMAYVLAHALVFAAAYTETSGIAAGLMVGFWNWLGFIAPVTVGTVLWEGKSWKLWLLNSGYYLVSLLLMGVVLAVMA